MEHPQLKVFSPKAAAILAQVETISETQAFVAEDGPLEKEIRSFLISAASMLKRDCKIQVWKQNIPAKDEDGYFVVQLYPKNWELPKVGPVAFNVTWSNPFDPEPEDLSVELCIPWNWSHSQGLRDLVSSHLPEGFTNVYDGDADASVPYWRYVCVQDFADGSHFDAEGFYQVILSAFSGLLSLRPTIDEYIAKCGDATEPRPARRELGIVAVVDTETAGSQQELIELAVVNAAYDKQSGEVFGILEQYEGLREPKCPISKTDQRLNGLGIDEVRGRSLDEQLVKAMLMRADFVVAHNAPFDKARLMEQFSWAADLDWRDSLNGVNWETETRDLPSLLEHHGIDCETSHRAGCDARALLELLSYKVGGKTYLGQLLALEADAVVV